MVSFVCFFVFYECFNYFRCKVDDDYIYSGTLCEESSSSKERQRKIMLGVTIPIIVILFMLVIILCVKINYKG